jgi:NAD(P)-dependent dehydrogenase (short-subunit alcohol dehydrogenase family)
MSGERRTALVTGGTSGIGLAVCRALAQAGWWVQAVGLDDHGELAAELAAADTGRIVVCDLTENGVPERVVTELVSLRGHLDLLVNCAGVHALATIEESTPELIDRILGLNLRAAMLVCRAAVPAMRRGGGGTIVNIGSEAGVVAVRDQVAYNVSKAGIAMLTRSIAVDHADDGIRAITVSPGTTRTRLVAEAIASAPDPEAHERMLAESRPAKRLGRPEEIAAAVVFVAADEVAYMTGAEILIDGGYTAQ